MATMEICQLCGGHGFVSYYHDLGPDSEEDLETRCCPSCHGLGGLEPWRQLGIGIHRQKEWTGHGPPYREEGMAIQAIIRQREEAG